MSRIMMFTGGAWHAFFATSARLVFFTTSALRRSFATSARLVFFTASASRTSFATSARLLFFTASALRTSFATSAQLVFFTTCAWLVLTTTAVAQVLPISMPVEGTRLDVDVHGNIFILDADQGTLTQYDPFLHRQAVIGGPGWEDGRFDQPAGLWARNGLDVYVADYGNHRIQRFDRSLSFVSSFSTREAEDAATRFGYPTDVTLSRLGALFICDSENSRVVKLDVANRVETAFGGFGGGAGRLEHPVQVEIGADDLVYVLDPPRIVAFDSFGNFFSSIGEGFLHDPQILAADERGVVVVDGTDLVFFSESHRPLPRLPISSLTGEAVETVRSLSLAGGRMYLLAQDVLWIVADPRPRLKGDLLDKEDNSQ
jgi:hypothetical protein